MRGQTNILDRFLDPLTDCLTPEVAHRLIELRLDPETQARIDVLRTKANEAQLSEEEQAEYEDLVEGLDLIGIFKAKARAALARHAS
jgi:hypothetical protein